jgi:hypothetical protein
MQNTGIFPYFAYNIRVIVKNSSKGVFSDRVPYGIADTTAPSSLWRKPSV